MDTLFEEVQEFQERWNSMVLDVTEDFTITCDEAEAVRKWLVTERKAYNILKKKINHEIRAARHAHEQRAETLDAEARKDAKVELAAVVYRGKTMLLAADELLLKADEMGLRVARLLEGCEEET